MFPDPQSVTIDTVATDFNRVGSTNPEKKGVYSDDADSHELSITQNKSSNRFRRELRFTNKKVAADPISATNKEISTSIILTVDEPRWGYTDAELKILLQSVLDWANVSDNADQMLRGEF